MKKINHTQMSTILGGSATDSLTTQGTLNAVSNCVIDAYSNHGFASIVIAAATWVSWGGATLVLGAACYSKLHR